MSGPIQHKALQVCDNKLLGIRPRPIRLIQPGVPTQVSTMADWNLKRKDFQNQTAEATYIYMYRLHFEFF